jgi:hypothetical protein
MGILDDFSKRKAQNISDALRQITDAFIAAGTCSAYEINNGECEEWAYAVFEALPGMVEIWETGAGSRASHLFVKIGSKFYDAEALDGVADYMQLPLFTRRNPDHPYIDEPVMRVDHNIDLQANPDFLQSEKLLGDWDESDLAELDRLRGEIGGGR